MKKFPIIFSLLLCYFFFCNPVKADTVETTVMLVGPPHGVTVNPETNKVYVTNTASQPTTSNEVSVIDGSSFELLGSIIINPIDILFSELTVNPKTNKLYVSYAVDFSKYKVSVIDVDMAANKEIAVISGIDFTGNTNDLLIGINSETNKIYATGLDGGNVLYVIDGLTDTIETTIPLPDSAKGLAVDSENNEIYVSRLFASLSIIDGNTNTIIENISGIGSPRGVAVNPETKKIYAVDQSNSAVNVIDRESKAVIGSIMTGQSPSGVVVNSKTNKIYVANNNTINVIDGNTNTVINTFTKEAGTEGIAINENTGKVFVANNFPNTLTVIGSESTSSSSSGGDETNSTAIEALNTALDNFQNAILNLKNTSSVEIFTQDSIDAINAISSGAKDATKLGFKRCVGKLESAIKNFRGRLNTIRDFICTKRFIKDNLPCLKKSEFDELFPPVNSAFGAVKSAARADKDNNGKRDVCEGNTQ